MRVRIWGGEVGGSRRRGAWRSLAWARRAIEDREVLSARRAIKEDEVRSTAATIAAGVGAVVAWVTCTAGPVRIHPRVVADVLPTRFMRSVVT